MGHQLIPAYSTLRMLAKDMAPPQQLWGTAIEPLDEIPVASAAILTGNPQPAQVTEGSDPCCDYSTWILKWEAGGYRGSNSKEN